ncbi:MAG: hypothetical protein IJP33_01660 [Firmicutes bacterium]|nr:hypothetical protein [Bacillota bacterium]
MSEENFLFEKEVKQEEILQGEQTSNKELQAESMKNTSESEDFAQEKSAEELNESPQMPGEISESNSQASLSYEAKILPYHERYYLKYREGKRSAALDLEGTKSFLQEIGFDGGELRQAREGKSFAEAFRNADKNKSNHMYCSYCGSEIAGVEFYRLPDGRVRCTACSSTVVKTKAEVEELCQRVIANMDNFFGATIDVPISVEVVDELKLKKKIGIPLGTKDSQSMLILGVAINKNKKYKIILENGVPRISLIATFAHELTHIWQYMHWDNKKNFKECPKSKRLLIYEGMAKWAEIQYLYLVGETNVAKREEYITRNRKDEYGLGFCLYENRYPLSREAMTCEETPFTPDRYPFD